MVWPLLPREPLARSGRSPAGPSLWARPAHLDIFLRLRSSALAFWADVRLSASARLSTAMARKTLSSMSEATR